MKLVLLTLSVILFIAGFGLCDKPDLSMNFKKSNGDFPALFGDKILTLKEREDRIGQARKKLQDKLFPSKMFSNDVQRKISIMQERLKEEREENSIPEEQLNEEIDLTVESEKLLLEVKDELENDLEKELKKNPVLQGEAEYIENELKDLEEEKKIE